MNKKIRRAVLAAALLAGISGRAAVFAAASEEEGKVLNIYTWNEELQNRMQDHYPEYETVDSTTGKIGEVTVCWNISSSEDYQSDLDAALLKQEETADDDKIDLFLVEAEYARKYVDTAYTVDIADLGITEEDLLQQFPYTLDVVTDSEGNLKGTAWQSCPGVLIYRRDIAKEVLGTEDPKKVQEYLCDWDSFAETASMMKEAGYYMTASVYDLYRVFSGKVTDQWVEDGTIHIDHSRSDWAEFSKEMLDAGETSTCELWSEEWSEGLYTEGNVFCYFGPSWFYDFSMAYGEEGSVGADGGWAAAEGPQGFFWGGTWICGAAGTDNPTLVKEIMLNLTCNEEIMTEIAKTDGDFVNNAAVMEALTEEEIYNDAVLGNQNPVSVFLSGIGTIDQSGVSGYDPVCNQEFQNAMKSYFEGESTFEEAADLFYKAVTEIYSDLRY